MNTGAESAVFSVGSNDPVNPLASFNVSGTVLFQL
jgi:hypothetical protein